MLRLRQWALPNSVQLDPMFVDMMRDLKSVLCLHTSTRSHSARTHACRPYHLVSKAPCHTLHQDWRSFCTGAAGGAGRTQGKPSDGWPTVEQVMLSDRDILDEFKQRIAGHFSDSSSQLGDMQPQVGL